MTPSKSHGRLHDVVIELIHRIKPEEVGHG